MQVLVVEAHEGELDTGELALLDTGLGGAEAHLADLLEVGVGRLTLADAGDLQDLRAQIIGGGSWARQCAETGAGCRRERGHAGRSLQNIAPGRTRADELFVKTDSHLDSSQKINR